MSSIESRKSEHIEIALRLGDKGPSSGWDDVVLTHEALPEVDLDAVDLGVEVFGRRFSLPLMVAGMTGGHGASVEVNARLAKVAARHGLPMGLGSQRAALLDPALEEGYRVARQAAPDAFLVGNVGANQLIEQESGPAFGLEDLERAVEMIAADAMAIHLNALEELIQPEGDRRTAGLTEAIAEIAAGLSVPVIVKETGAGLAPPTAAKIARLPVAAVDVGGAGGTSFAAIERERAAARGLDEYARLGATLGEWGVPTAVSVMAARAAGKPVIATGGVRNGLHAAKALTLGADMVGVARPLLAAALEGDAALDAWIENFRGELKAVMMLCGCRRSEQLRERPFVLHGHVRDWVETFGLPRRRPAATG